MDHGIIRGKQAVASLCACQDHGSPKRLKMGPTAHAAQKDRNATDRNLRQQKDDQKSKRPVCFKTATTFVGVDGECLLEASSWDLRAETL